MPRRERDYEFHYVGWVSYSYRATGLADAKKQHARRGWLGKLKRITSRKVN